MTFNDVLMIGTVILTIPLTLQRAVQEEGYHRDYLRRAALQMWWILALWIGVFSGIAWAVRAFLEKAFSLGPTPAAILAGFLSITLPQWMLSFIVGKLIAEKHPEAARLLDVRQMVIGRVTELRQEDNTAWQDQRGDWDFGIKPGYVAGRITKLYEYRKYEIAAHKSKPELVLWDQGYVAGTLFFLLVDTFGPHAVRHRLASDVIEPSESWNGKNRRERRGTKADRQSGRDNPPRLYDDELMRLICSRGSRS